MAKSAKTIYVDIAKVMEWEEFCEKTGRVLSRTIELAMKEYIENNK